MQSLCCDLCPTFWCESDRGRGPDVLGRELHGVRIVVKGTACLETPPGTNKARPLWVEHEDKDLGARIEIKPVVRTPASAGHAW